MFKKNIIFITNYDKKEILKLINIKQQVNFIYINCKNKVHIKKFKNILKQKITENYYLISFYNNFIFNKEVICKFKNNRIINFHPGTHNYPGRDVSHFACYDKVKKFGGIIHYVNNKIDNGKIIDEKKYYIKKGSNHYRYTSAGHKFIRYLLKKYFNLFLNDKIRIKKRINWSKKIYSRKMFLNKLKIKNNLTKENFKHYFNSFYTYEYPSLFYFAKSKKIYIKKI